MAKSQTEAVTVGASLGFAVGGAAAFIWEVSQHGLLTFAIAYGLVAAGALGLGRRSRRVDIAPRMLAYFLAILFAIGLHLAGSAWDGASDKSHAAVARNFGAAGFVVTVAIPPDKVPECRKSSTSQS